MAVTAHTIIHRFQAGGAIRLTVMQNGKMGQHCSIKICPTIDKLTEPQLREYLAINKELVDFIVDEIFDDQSFNEVFT